MAFDKTTAGQFRGNPHGSIKNNLRLVDPDTPGTPLEDTVTVDTTAATLFNGITYTGKDGVTKYYDFFNEVGKESAQVPYTVQVADGREALMLALGKLLGKFEVDPVVTVEGSGNNFDIVHIGSGTMNSIRVDGSDQNASRGAITALVEIEIEAAAAESAGTKGKKGKKAATE